MDQTNFTDCLDYEEPLSHKTKMVTILNSEHELQSQTDIVIPNTGIGNSDRSSNPESHLYTEIENVSLKSQIGLKSICRLVVFVIRGLVGLAGICFFVLWVTGVNNISSESQTKTTINSSVYKDVSDTINTGCIKNSSLNCTDPNEDPIVLNPSTISIAFLSSSLFTTISGLTCFNCNGIRHPSSCNFVQRCEYGQVCQLQKVTDSNGLPLFNMGCISKQNCKCYRPDRCQKCCSDDLCNLKGCGETVPYRGGNYCFSCDGLSKAEYCGEVAFCNYNMTCYAEENVRFNETIYKRGCKKKSECTSTGTNFGRRNSADISTSTTRRTCCHYELCNQDIYIGSKIRRSQPQSPLRKKSSKRAVLATWDCGSKSPYGGVIGLHEFRVSPIPIKVPGVVSVTLNAVMTQCLDRNSNVSLKVTMDKEMSGNTYEIPCKNNFGTCLIPDIFDPNLKMSSEWKRVLTNLGVLGTEGVLEQGSLTYESRKINLTVIPEYEELLTGSFEIRTEFEFRSFGQMIGCIHVGISVVNS